MHIVLFKIYSQFPIFHNSIYAAAQCRFSPDISSFGLSISSDGRRVRHEAGNFDHHWALADIPVRSFNVRIVRNPLGGGLLVGLVLPFTPLRNLQQEHEERRLSRQASLSTADTRSSTRRPQKLLTARADVVPTPTASLNKESHAPHQTIAVASVTTVSGAQVVETAVQDDEDEGEGERFPAKGVSASEESFISRSFMLEMRSGALLERGVWGPSQSLGHNVLEGSLVCVEKNYSTRAIRFVIRTSSGSKPVFRIAADEKLAQGTNASAGAAAPARQHHKASVGTRVQLHSATITGATSRRHTVEKVEDGLSGVLYGWRPTGLNAEQFGSLVGAVMMYINGDEAQIENSED